MHYRMNIPPAETEQYLESYIDSEPEPLKSKILNDNSS